MEWLNSLDEYLGKYKWVLAIGLIGGLLNVGSRPDKGLGRKVIDLLLGIASSVFFGWISYEVILFIWKENGVALAGCGFFAWKGATWFGEKVDKWVDAKIEAEKHKGDFGGFTNDDRTL